MTTVDELTLELYEKMKAATAQGNQLQFANEIAKKILTMTPASSVPARVVPQRCTVETTSRPWNPQPRSVEVTGTDSVRVSNL